MAPQAAANGVLPVTVLQKNGPASTPRGPKAPQPRLKLVLRRLPPGLTKAEFEAALGEEWKLGAGKVDWVLFKKGKVSKDLAKPSRPSRAYVHVTSQQYVAPLGDHVRATSFNDAAKSSQDAALVGPPTLEFAPYHRIPGGRRRNDNRQGTIDQDQEFKDFLESLTNPIAKPAAPESDAHKEEKVTVTPLIAALREKKANRDKTGQKGSSKHGRGESKEDSGDKKTVGKSGKEAASGEKSRRITKAEKDKLAKDAVKALNKESASSRDAAAAEKSASASASPAPERKRGNTSIAKSMLQRDLGLGPPPSRRRGTKRELTPATQEVGAQSEDTAAGKQKVKEVPAAATGGFDKSATASPKKDIARPSRSERRAMKATATLTERTNNRANGEKSDNQAKSTPTAPAPVILKKPQSTQISTPPKGPATSRAPPTEPAAARTPAQPQATSAKSDSTIASRAAASPGLQPLSPIAAVTGRQAFLKHANASQGITEPLIEEALKVYGDIEKVEIDKRKGFAYVDFTDAEGLVKAIAASPVKVAQGAVQVLERKEKVVRTRPHPGPHAHPHSAPHGPPTGPARGRGGFMGRGRGRGGARGGGNTVPAAGASTSDTGPSTPAPAPHVPVQNNDIAT